ncbi:MAG: hypothetical protein WCK89_00070 [bacterium]
MKSKASVSHDWQEETLESKARWFQTLPMHERMQMFCDLTDLALTVNPSLPEKKYAEPTARRFQVISAT